jgi:hypothetical protein
MNQRFSNPNSAIRMSPWLRALPAFLFIFALFTSGNIARAQATPDSSPPVELDHVVAVVNNQAILQSDVDEEMRFTALQSTVLPSSQNTPTQALNRLIDRALIDNERLLQPSFSAVTDVQVETGVDELKKTIPGCIPDMCTTYVDWENFLKSHGFTLQQAHDRVLERLQILKFIDWRFGSAVHITQQQVATYYQSTLLPAYAREKISPPPLSSVARRIREILQQQRITGLMDDWLKNLRAQGEVHIVDPAYASVGGTSE